MIYEVRVRLFLTSLATAKDAFTRSQGLFPKAQTINPNQANAEISYCELIENHHDETPTSPCFLISGIQTKSQ